MIVIWENMSSGVSRCISCTNFHKPLEGSDGFSDWVWHIAPPRFRKKYTNISWWTISQHWLDLPIAESICFAFSRCGTWESENWILGERVLDGFVQKWYMVTSCRGENHAKPLHLRGSERNQKKRSVIGLVLREQFAGSHYMWRQKHHGFQWHIPSWVAFHILYITWMEISRQIMPIVHRKIKHHIEYIMYIYIKPIVCHCQIWLLECIWLFVATPLFCAVKMFELRMGQGQTRWLFSSQFWKDMNHPVLQRLAIHIPNKLNGYIIKICILMYNLWICPRMMCTVWICVV